MYINLFPNRQLRSTKKSVLAMGAFFAAGGTYALMREIMWQGTFRVEWAVSSAVLLLIGFLAIAVAMDKIRLKDVYFSMTPERISYRLSVVGREQLLCWQDVAALQVSEQWVNFEGHKGQVVKLNLGLIQQPEIARHVSRSIVLAAMEKEIPVNGVLSKEPAVSA